MKTENRLGALPIGGAFLRQGRRFTLKSAAAACALSLALFGCSDSKKGVPKVVTDPDDDKPGTGTVVSAIDSLVKSTKGTGKGVVTGFLTGEGKSVAKAVLKQAKNAAGEVRLLSRTEIPLSGATVLIFNAEKPTTLADTTLKTDTSGTYTAVLPEGKYFGYAVYLDLETFQLVTTQIPNMNSVRDTVVKMDTAVAIEDVTAPTVVGVYDAVAANADGVFLVGSVPDRDARININFSEPMNRESAKGVVMGKVDTSSSSLALSDTLEGVTLTWSGDSKQLTLNAASLSAGVQYGILIPVNLKDLAKNTMETGFKATFAPVAAAELEAVAFAAAASFPEDAGTLKPIQNPALSFNRPVDVFSVVKGAVIEPAVTGFWEVSGARATFIHKQPFEVGKTYRVTFPATVKDLSGQALGAAHAFSFTVKDFEGAAKDASGADREVALAVETMFNAYLAGDLGRFAAAFHANFRMYQGSEIQSKTQFLDGMKAEVGDRIAMVSGIPAPVFDVDSAACRDRVQRWKVAAQGDTSAWLWVQSYVNPGSVPLVWGKDRKEIDRSKLSWDRTGPRFTFEGKVYGFAPDFSKFGASVSMDAAIDNARFMADVMAKTSTIVLAPVKMERKESFLVDGGMAVSRDSARLAVKMTNTEKFSRGDFDFNRSCGGSLEHTRYEILKFLLVNDGSRWLVLTIVAPDEEIRREDFDKTVDVRQDFGGANVKPISLVAPVNGQSNVAAADGSVKFEFNGVAHDSVGGYLVGLAEDPKFTGGRPPYGALLFVKAGNRTGGKESFSLDASGKVTAGEASVLLRRVQDLMLPGWERTLFEFTLAKLYDQAGGFAGVYNWKVIAVRDTSAAQFLQNGFKMARFLGESDFGGVRGYFAVKGFPSGDFMARIDTIRYVPPPVNGGTVGFGDMDQDGVPDFMEQKYGSDMRDRNSFPDFRVDTDGDKLCDFLEQKLDPEGRDSLVSKAGDATKIREEIAALARLVPPIVIEDADGDGFPDDVEQLYGFNPRDALNNPGTKVRASLPLGVFAGKVQMGAMTHGLSFKLYQDSAKALWVASTAYFGKDTVIDTSRANFNDMMGEVQIALRLPANGPDSGRALLLRGRYEAFQSLLMGPVDMIQAPARTSVNFGSGPYVGQFAASGRGEDVSRYLPGSTGTTGPVTGPVPPPPTLPGYRPPPTGTSEGSKVVFAGPRATLINDFGDTLAVFDNLAWRSQPDGSHEIWGEKRIVSANGMMRTEMGGRIYMAGEGWVMDGHVFQSVDSAGFHRDIPGQLSFKAAREALAKAADVPGLNGTMTGWIAQDKNGSGFTTTQPIDTTCRVGTACPPPPPPPGSTFGIPFMGGLERFHSAVRPDTVGNGGAFYVSVGGIVFVGTLDSAHVQAAKFPWCNQVILSLKPVPLGEAATDVQRSEFERHKQFLSGTDNGLMVVLEDQFRPGVPARLEKARDYMGGVRVNVLLVEKRPPPFDYGREGMQCGTGGTTLPPPCPAGQICPPPGGTTLGIDPATTPFYNGTVDIVKMSLGVSANTVLLVRDRMSAGERLVVDLASVRKDDMRNAVTANLAGSQGGMTVVFLGQAGGSPMLLKENLPIVAPYGTSGVPGDSTACPAGQTCPPPGGQGPMFLQVEISSLVAALATVENRVHLVRDSAGRPVELGVVTVDPTSLKLDEGMRAIVGNELGKVDVKLAFLAEGEVRNPMMRNGIPVALKLMDSHTGGTSTDTTRPPLYRGTQANLQTILERVGWVAKLMQPPPAQPMDVTIASASLATDGQMFIAYEAGNPAKLFVFMGDRMDPTKPAMSADGKPIVSPKPVMAGP